MAFLYYSDQNSILGGVRLPPDTEIIKYTSSIVGPKIPGTTNRGRKKTISLDPPLVSVHPAHSSTGMLIERASKKAKLVSNFVTIPLGATNSVTPAVSQFELVFNHTSYIVITRFIWRKFFKFNLCRVRSLIDYKQIIKYANELSINETINLSNLIVSTRTFRVNDTC